MSKTPGREEGMGGEGWQSLLNALPFNPRNKNGVRGADIFNVNFLLHI